MAVQHHRPLRPAEEIVAWEPIVHALDAGKERLEAAIEAEKRRAVRNVLRQRRASIDITPPMVAVLVALRVEGRRQARLEAAALGVDLGRLFAVNPVDPDDAPEALRPLLLRLRQLLGVLFVRVQHEAVELSLEGFSAAAIRSRLLHIPGARNAAGLAVSKALALGLGDVFEANADAFSGWEVSSAGDAAVCKPCREDDGKQFPTPRAASVILADGFGPNLRCLGGGRCRCRLVPLGVA